MNDPALITLGLIFGIGLPWVIFAAGLDMEVSERGVRLRFRPFHHRWITFEWEQTCNVDALAYRPVRDYGGWGLWYGRQGKAYSVSGNKGVRLTLKDGKSVLIGSTNQDVRCAGIRGRLVSD